MHCNVWEFCWDWHDSRFYQQPPITNPSGPSLGGGRVFRGGSFWEQILKVRTAVRSGLPPSALSNNIGFRPSRTYNLIVDGQVAVIPPGKKDQPDSAIAPFDAKQAKVHQAAWAEHLGVEVETNNSIGMKFRVIPPGEFLMGSNEEDVAKLSVDAKQQKALIVQIMTESPQHRVTLTKPFGMSIHEVTRGQFRQFVEANGYKTDAEKDGKGGSGFKDGKHGHSPEFLWNTQLGFDTEQTDEHPVLNVSWNDAVAFCEWLSRKEGVTYRLPTEAEWEFVCRDGSLARFSFGNEESKLGDYTWYGNQGGRGTKPVGQKLSNSLGLFDLHGNVWEWCQDWDGPYTITAVDPVGPSQGSDRLLRGGSFNLGPSHVRSANRLSFPPSKRTVFVGFRPSRTYNLSP